MSTAEHVWVETPRGNRTIAKVLDRNPTSRCPDGYVTVDVAGATLRYEASDIEPV